MLVFFGMDLQDIIVFIILVCHNVQMLVSVGQCSIAMHKETFKCPNAASVFGHNLCIFKHERKIKRNRDT